MHIYEKDGNKFPSVTTVLSIIKEESVIKWANSLGFRHKDYTEELNRYADFGTYMHAIMEKYMSPEKDIQIADNIFWNKKANDIMENVIPVFDTLGITPSNTIFTEEELVSSSLGFGGTMDWVGTSNHGITLMDYKTSNRFKPKHPLQLAPYAQLLEENGIKIDCAIIMLLRDDICRYKIWTYDELTKYRDCFNYCLKLWNELSKTVGIL